MGSFVVGFEGRASCRLFVAEFVEHGEDGAGVATALVDAACFSFRRGGDRRF